MATDFNSVLAATQAAMLPWLREQFALMFDDSPLMRGAPKLAAWIRTEATDDDILRMCSALNREEDPPCPI